jgi:hypothetical protein
MKYCKRFFLQLMLLWGLSLPLFAQSPRAETVEPALQSLDSKLDVILRRLDAIEKRLGRLEGQRNVPMPPSEAAKQNETSVILVINWYRPRKLAIIPPAVDAGMLIDGVERALKIENHGGKDPLQNLMIPKHDGVIFKESILRRK